MGEELDLGRPFTVAEFTTAGHDRMSLRRSAYTCLMRSVWVRRDAVDRDSMFRAALLVHPSAAFLSHLSAAAVRGLPVPDHAFVHVTVFRERDRRWRPQIKPHVTERRRRVEVVRGMRTADVVHVFIDCAGMLPLVDLVVLGDAIVRRHGMTAAQLLRACRSSRDYYAGLATTAAELVRDGVDSPMETRLRLLIVLAGLPEPRVDHRTYWEDGTLRRRFDLYYERVRLVVEFDGRQHAESVRQWEVDLERREELDDDGRRIIVVTARGVYRQPERTLQRIRRQLVLRGWGSVPALDDTWRVHFAAAGRVVDAPGA